MIPLVVAPDVCFDGADDVVDNCGCTFCSLAEALASVTDQLPHVFVVGPGTYTQSLPLRVNAGHQVRFEANFGTVTLTNNGLGEVFVATDAADLTLFGPFSLTAFNDRALRVESNARVTLNGAVLFTIGLQVEGGAVRVQNGRFDATDSLFLDNVATGNGGQLLAVDSQVTLTDCRFSGGFGGNGGAVAIVKDAVANTTLDVVGTTFEGNLAADAGGAIYVEGGPAVTLTDTTFTRNTAVTDGGAIADALPAASPIVSTISVTRGTFTENTADGNGGAIRVLNATALSVDQSTFEHNDATNGGALWIGGLATADLRHSLWCENTADNGGAIASATATPQSWWGNRWLSNSAQSSGGAVAHSGADLAIRHGSLLANASTVGAAVNSDGAGTLTIASTLVGWTEGATALVGGNQLLDYDLFWANDFGNYSAASIGAGGIVTGQDPLMDRFVAALGCDAADDYYSWWGPLTDGGDPAEPPDPFGSIPDIGAWGSYVTDDDDGTPWAVDLDDDGYPALYDCADGDSAVAPDVVDTDYDGLDSNCDDQDDFDRDGDGYDGGPNGDDCADYDPEVHPNAKDSVSADLNCDGMVDFDGDTVGKLDDCDDTDPAVHPGAVEDAGIRDLDCSGPFDLIRPLEPRTCSTGPAPASWAWLAILLLGQRARRR